MEYGLADLEPAYRAGAEGYPDTLAFGKDAAISRAEVFTMMDRMVHPETRIGYVETLPETPDTRASALDTMLGSYAYFVNDGTYTGDKIYADNIDVVITNERRDEGATLRVRLNGDLYIVYEAELEARGAENGVLTQTSGVVWRWSSPPRRRRTARISHSTTRVWWT